jgi:peroxisomal 2,4-dienoyl-CoA reductase
MPDASAFRDGLFTGQVGIVTGGGTGIGFGIAELLASLGMHVVLASRRVEHIEPAAERLRQSGHQASAATLDVRDSDRVREVIAGVAERHGRLDLLVNNAAGNFYVPSETMSPNAWRSVIEIDLSGTFFCSQAALPHLRASGGGSIVNISMTLHYRGWPQMAHATAAKGHADTGARVGNGRRASERGGARSRPDRRRAEGVCPPAGSRHRSVRERHPWRYRHRG